MATRIEGSILWTLEDLTDQAYRDMLADMYSGMGWSLFGKQPGDRARAEADADKWLAARKEQRHLERTIGPIHGPTREDYNRIMYMTKLRYDYAADNAKQHMLVEHNMLHGKAVRRVRDR